VLDVFAGSGVVGLEALSRGATWCAFVEHAGAALKAIRRNIVGLMGDLAKQSTQVLRADAFRPLHWMPLVQQTPVDLVIVDPPYPRSGDASESGPVGRLLAGLSGGELLAKEAVVILRHEARVEYDQHAYGRLRATDVRRYGNMAVTYLALQTARTGGTAIT
jgi:16S rRNA (guanine966-N2)-methyltransferase